MAPSDNGSTGMGGLTGEGSGLPEFEDQNPSKKGRVHLIKQAIPSWLVSTFVHVAAILVLGAWNIEPIQKELKLMLSSAEALEDGEDLQATAMEEASASELQPSDSAEAPSDVPVVDSNIEATSVDLSQVVVDVPLSSMNSMASLTPKNAMAAQANATMKQALTGRSKETKRDLLRKFGGSDATEKAVSMALKWLAEHQNKQNGSWTLAHGPDNPGSRQSSFNAATGMALMCFLGAGQTHMEGEYKEVVFGGLSFLIKNMKFQKGLGSWYVGRGQDDMYAHGIATIALCEAYGMTRDPALIEAAQSGINFLAYAQNPTTGGWHYSPGIGLGDTSIVGWQMMAIKSAAMSGLTVDLDVVRRANLFLDAMSWEEGTSYHYSFDSVAKKAKYNQSCTACALLCRMYSGMKKDHPTVKAIVAKFDKAGPSRTGTYYNYYATQVMKQHGGPEWDRWNVRMRDQLIGLQSQSGPSTGSWFWEDSHSHSTTSGGRFYTTCMATMILEVYYRYLPIYAEQGEEDAFEL